MPQDSAHEFVFISDTIKPDQGEAMIRGSEHHHLSRVLKIKSGQDVFVTDGRGVMCRGRVRRIGSRETRVDILERRSAEAPPRRITLALGRIRKDRFEAAVEQCTELGVARVVPFRSRKSRPHAHSEHFNKRLNRIAQAAVKQSFQATIPVIESERDFEALLELVAAADVAVVGEQESPALSIPPPPAAVLIVVGPEGGLVREERDALARGGAAFATAAPTRLRSETAAVSLISQVLLLSD
jgi:16S rRNA (uracil1498-N3)-methyltransferase